MKSEIIRVSTGSRDTVADITGQCAEFVRPPAGGGAVLLHVFVPHATAGVAILELGSGSDSDLLAALADLLPADDRWRHAHGSRGHGRARVLPGFVEPYATIPVLGGRLALGTWQSIALVDVNVDNPDRRVRLSFLAGWRRSGTANECRYRFNNCPPSRWSRRLDPDTVGVPR